MRRRASAWCATCSARHWPRSFSPSCPSVTDSSGSGAWKGEDGAKAMAKPVRERGPTTRNRPSGATPTSSCTACSSTGWPPWASPRAAFHPWSRRRRPPSRSCSARPRPPRFASARPWRSSAHHRHHRRRHLREARNPRPEPAASPARRSPARGRRPDPRHAGAHAGGDAGWRLSGLATGPCRKCGGT